MFQLVQAILLWTAAASVSGYIFWKGGVHQKWGAALLLFGWLASQGVDVAYGVKYGVLLVDSLCLIGYLILSVRDRSLWSLMASVFQFDDVACHLGKILAPRLGGYGYVTGILIFGAYGLVLALVFSLWEARQDARYIRPAAG
jgi:hypothetical protein